MRQRSSPSGAIQSLPSECPARGSINEGIFDENTKNLQNISKNINCDDFYIFCKIFIILECFPESVGKYCDVGVIGCWRHMAQSLEYDIVYRNHVFQKNSTNLPAGLGFSGAPKHKLSGPEFSFSGGR